MKLCVKKIYIKNDTHFTQSESLHIAFLTKCRHPHLEHSMCADTNNYCSTNHFQTGKTIVFAIFNATGLRSFDSFW